MLFRMATLLILLLPVSAASAADAHEPHEGIRETARLHALDKAAGFSGEVEVTAAKLDRRLRLAACDKPLLGYDSPNGIKPGRNVVGVRCEGSKPWKIYVTVNIATIEAVVVSTRPISRGQLLATDDLRVEKRDTGRLHKAYYTDVSSLIGLRAKRNIAAGRVLEAGLLKRRQLVKRGAAVEILASQGALQVRMRGEALANGSKGDRIRIRNLSSGRAITGEVIGSGMIRVTP